MPDDLKDFEAKLDEFRRKGQSSQTPPPGEDELTENMNIGMRAGSEFMAHLIAGGLLGWTADHFLKTTPLFMILLVLAGFGTGLYRTYHIMNKKD